MIRLFPLHIGLISQGPSAVENTCALIIRQSPKLGTRSPHERTRAMSDEGLSLLPIFEGFHWSRTTDRDRDADQAQRNPSKGKPSKVGKIPFPPSQIARVRKTACWNSVLVQPPVLSNRTPKLGLNRTKYSIQNLTIFMQVCTLFSLIY